MVRAAVLAFVSLIAFGVALAQTVAAPEATEHQAHKLVAYCIHDAYAEKGSPEVVLKILSRYVAQLRPQAECRHISGINILVSFPSMEPATRDMLTCVGDCNGLLWIAIESEIADHEKIAERVSDEPIVRLPLTAEYQDRTPSAFYTSEKLPPTLAIEELGRFVAIDSTAVSVVYVRLDKGITAVRLGTRRSTYMVSLGICSNKMEMARSCISYNIHLFDRPNREALTGIFRILAHGTTERWTVKSCSTTYSLSG